MIKIYLVRHGETDWNLEDRIQGQIQVSLNNLGVQQANAAARFLEGISFEAIYTSNLKRAIETAQIISKGKKDVKQCSDFNERNFGDWQTKLWKEVYIEIPNIKDVWSNEGLRFSPPNGETLGDMYERVIRQFEEIMRNHFNDCSILIVGHGGPIKAILSYASRLPPQDMHTIPKLNNGSISIINYSSDYNIDKINYLPEY